MRSSRLLCAVAVLSLCCLGRASASGPVAPELSPEQRARIGEFVQRWMALRQAPGIAVGIVSGGETVYAEGFGVESLDRPDDPVTPDSLFHLASNSKPFVAATLLRLVADGRLDLDTPIQRLLPYFRLDDPRAPDITVRRMLSHVSGMPDETDYGWGDTENLDDGALERYTRSLGEHALIADPGAEFHYSNMAYEVLGDLIAKLTGMTFEQAVRQTLLEPLGMSHSSFLLADVDPERLTDPHDRTLMPFVSPVRPYTREHAPSSTLYSSAREMCHWMLMNLDGGAFAGHGILPPALHASMVAPAAPIGGSGRSEQIGISWFLGHLRGEPTISHAGRDLGYGSMVILVPGRSLGVVVLGNAHFGPIGQVAEGIVDLLLGYEPPEPRTSVRYAVAAIIAESGVDAGLAAYSRLEQSEPEAHLFGPNELALVGDDVADALGIAAAIDVFVFNAARYPESVDARRALGEAYLTGALEAFRATLGLDPDEPTATEVLRRLER